MEPLRKYRIRPKGDGRSILSTTWDGKDWELTLDRKNMAGADLWVSEVVSQEEAQRMSDLMLAELSKATRDGTVEKSWSS